MNEQQFQHFIAWLTTEKDLLDEEITHTYSIKSIDEFTNGRRIVYRELLYGLNDYPTINEHQLKHMIDWLLLTKHRAENKLDARIEFDETSNGIRVGCREILHMIRGYLENPEDYGINED